MKSIFALFAEPSTPTEKPKEDLPFDLDRMVADAQARLRRVLDASVDQHLRQMRNRPVTLASHLLDGSTLASHLLDGSTIAAFVDTANLSSTRFAECQAPKVSVLWFFVVHPASVPNWLQRFVRSE